MEYGINNEMNYPTLQIISKIVLKKKGNEEKHEKTPTQIPPGGMGKGLERPYSKGKFIYYLLQYQRTDISVLLSPYIG